MTLDEFVATYDGKEIDTDGAYGGQCMDLMHQYLLDVYNLPLSLFAAPTAYAAYQGANDPRFTKTANSPTGVPEKGDLVFWNTGIGSAGHVAVFLEGDVNTFTSFDQNFPTGSLCHKQSHTYKSVAGWLHYIVPSDQQTIIDELRKARDDNWNLYQGEIAKNTELTKSIGDLQNENTKLKANVSEVQKQNTDLLDQLKNQAAADSTAIDAGLKAEQDLKLAQHTIQSVTDALHLPASASETDILKALDAAMQTPPQPPKKPVRKPSSTTIAQRVVSRVAELLVAVQGIWK